VARAKAEDAVARERALFIDLVGREISAIWRNVTRLGGQCVAALYLAGRPRSMDDLAAELGRSKSNVFSNLRALESLGIVRRVHIAGSPRDHYELAASYPDVIMLAFARKMAQTLAEMHRELDGIHTRIEGVSGGDAPTKEVLQRISRLSTIYAGGSDILEALLPPLGESFDIGALLKRLPGALARNVGRLVRRDD